jgi:hypothetical protein
MHLSFLCRVGMRLIPIPARDMKLGSDLTNDRRLDGSGGAGVCVDGA